MYLFEILGSDIQIYKVIYTICHWNDKEHV